MTRFVLLVVALVCLESSLSTAEQAPGPPARDSNPRAQTGTARIRGRVVAAQTGQALRRAQVTLSGPAGLRRTATDGSGRYEFAGLPAGTFSLIAMMPGYVGLAYGQRRPLEPGTPVVVKDGEVLERMDLTLPRGSVISVRVTDDFGEPVVGAQVQLLRFQYAPDGQRRLNFVGTGGTSITDDRGELRAFGLGPGEYIISAMLRTQMLAGPTSLDDTSEGFAPTFYPGTMSAELAQPVSVGVGEETGVHFALVPSRLSRISGTVSDSQGRPLTGVSLQLTTRQGNGGSYSGGGGVAPDGSFTIPGVPPGEYTIDVRPAPRPGVPFNQLEGEFASVPIAVSGADLIGLRIVTGSGATISGRVVFDGASRVPTNQMRVFMQQLEPGMGLPFGQNSDPARNGTLGIDNRFQIAGASGRVFLQLSVGGWMVKSVMLDGRDITDEPLDLSGKTSVSDVVITMTDRLSTLAGQVSDSRGPVPRSVVVLIPTDATETAKVARLTRTLRPNAEGRFQFRGLRPGRYVAAALESLEEGRQFAPEVREQLRRAGREFTVNEGETVTLDLKIAGL